MKNFCCVADYNFLSRVLALDYSLKSYSKDYTLHLLCLDKKIYTNINTDTIKTYLIDFGLTKRYIYNNKHIDCKSIKKRE